MRAMPILLLAATKQQLYIEKIKDGFEAFIGELSGFLLSDKVFKRGALRTNKSKVNTADKRCSESFQRCDASGKRTLFRAGG